jgi:hypothetical protein
MTFSVLALGLLAHLFGARAYHAQVRVLSFTAKAI